MKKLTIIMVLLLLVLVAAPWGIGQLAESRVNAGLDRLVAEAPYLTIAERKWTRGWFRSEQQVTFELFAPWASMLDPAAKANDVVVAAPDAVPPAPAEGDAAASEGNVAAAERADTPTEGAVTPPPPPKPAVPIRFTVRNEILHGPVLWPASLGVARVNTRLELDAKTRQKILEIFGTDEPVRMSTRVGFFGGGTTRFYGDGRTIQVKGGKGSVAYDDFKLDVSYSGDLDDIDMQGSWPKLEILPAEGGSVIVDDVSLVSRNERILGDLYDTDLRLRVDEVRVVGPDKSETKVEGVHYLVDTVLDGDFLDFSGKFGSGKVKSKELTEMNLELEEVHYDFTVRRLHAKTLAEISTAFRQMYAKPMSTAGDLDAVLMTPLKQHGAELLKYDPELVIDRIGVATPEGDGYIKGVLRLKGATAQDLEMGAMALVGKVEADIHIEVAQKLVEKIPSGATTAGAAIDSGYATREGEKIMSHIEFKAGQLKVNGKVQGIPGIGGPPGAAEGMPPEGEVPPPPRE
jgi:uncharacterized protein YdgA (DUF945 family)